MTIDLRYPVRYCHFCDHIMFYHRYDNGDNIVYCNNPKSPGCMGFSYLNENGNLKIKAFNLCHTNRLCFTHAVGVSKDGCVKYTNRLLVSDPAGAPKIVENLFEVNTNVILCRESSIKLLDRLYKSIILLD